MVSSDTTINQQLLRAVPLPHVRLLFDCCVIMFPVVLEVDLSDDQHEVVGGGVGGSLGGE